MLLLGLSATATADDNKLKLGEFIPAASPQPAPEVSFTDTDDRPVSLKDFVGKPIIVNLWATWCHPCLKEMPSLVRLQQHFAGRLNVAAVSEDRGGAPLVLPFVAAQKLADLKIYVDPKGDVGHAFEVRGLPTSIVLDAQGRVVGRVEGAAEWDSDKMIDAIRPLLDAAPERPTHARSEPVNPPGG